MADNDGVEFEDLENSAAGQDEAAVPPEENAPANGEAEADGDGTPVDAQADDDAETPDADADADDTSEEGHATRTASDLAAVYDIPVNVSAVLGKSKMQVSTLLKLGRGAVVELDRKVGEAIDIYVNDRLVARGEVVVVEERLGVTMTEIIKTDRA